MRKKLFTFLLALVASAGALFAEIYSGTCGEYYDIDENTYIESTTVTWSLNTEDSTLTIGGYGRMKNWEIELSGYKPFTGLTSFAPWSLHYSSYVAHIIIEKDIEYIDKNSFLGCKNIVSISIDSENPIYDSRNDCNAIIEKATNSLIVGCSKSTIPNNVTSIGYNAFNGCSSLASVIIPNSVTSIGTGAFADCISLTSVTIPNSVTNIGDYAFIDCSSLQELHISDLAAWCKISFSNAFANPITYAHDLYVNGTLITDLIIPSSVTNIGEYAFKDCSGLTSVTIGNNVTSIGDYAFNGCTGLSSLTIGNSVTSIGNQAFVGCSGLTSIQWNAVHCADFTSTSLPFYNIRSQIISFTFGDEVEYVPAYLCGGMVNAEITIKNCKTEIGTHALDNCNYNIEGIYNIVLSDTTLCYDEELIIDGVRCDLQKTPNKKQTWTRNLQTINGCDSTISISILWRKLPDFSITTKDVYDTKNSGSISYQIDQSANYDGKYYYTLNGIRNASLSNLSEGNYRLVFYSEECGDSIVKNITIHQLGMKVNGMYYLLNENNHTATLTYRGTSYSDYNGEYSGNITIPKTITFDGKEYQVTGINSSTFSGCSNISTITMESETPISMYSSGLSSNCIIYVPYGSVNAYKSASGWRNYTIHVINPSHVTSTAGATSATITLGNTNEAQHIASCGKEGGAEEFAGNVIEYIGLEPNSEYANIPLFIKTKEGDLDNTTVSFTTTALELTTKPSKPVSSTTAILLAETNMSDAEVSCGFEYKRNDAPADMDGTKVFCPVASGQMAGRLKNLKDDVYYKYRAFYQSAAGNMYYGDWQYIFTGDVAVEFDPVLYTYTASAVTETTATISGYALAGSEDFTEQGFEYWAESRATEPATMSLRKMKNALGEHFFVPASGISMRVTLTDLDAGTIYKYRAYGKVGDQVYYGAEQTFTTRGKYVAPSYLITFVNWDGTELQKSQVATGTIPEYTGETPVRPGDDQHTYTFKGWTPELAEVTEDAVYTAEFTVEEATAILHIESDQVQCTKILRDGQILILRGDRIYTLTGQITQ